MKECDFVTVQGFMRTNLNLTGTELVVYAIIYGFSKDGVSVFSGSAQYLADWVDMSRRGMFKLLKRLTDRGLIIKVKRVKNGVQYTDYYANPKFFPAPSGVVNSGCIGSEQSSGGVVNSVHRGGELSSQGGGELSSYHKDNIYMDRDKDNIDNNSLSYLSQPVSDENGVEPTGQESFSDGAVIDGWNSIAELYKLSKIQKLTSNRRKKLQSRLKDMGMSLPELLNMISDKIRKSSFLRGKKLAYDGNGQWRIENADWFCDFDFFLQPSSLQKVAEDRYTDKTYLENPLEQKIISPDS